ncbi:hypothetical protein [Shinella sumterensis]|uniref:Uncharacterized protein n=1 Tax=Shinella sumterensis TaxID=1967501 RepID=A0AA50DBM5_9HYPH|nr:hypothetical protein [Shinella sumterensis]WLR96341.1 hypothetical protein Q9313_11455 [Shinella sumterensis]WLS09498.1 hypothetical protein Q9314_06905 [Shinella sumterensis]
MSVAPQQQVVAVYGGGGTFEADGLSQAFGGAAIFRNDATGAIFAGVWGARNASRFRREIREHMDVVLRREVPDARLVLWSAEGERPLQRRDGEG